METFKKEIPSEKINKFCAKEFGSSNKCSNILPSELYHSSTADVTERFIEIADKVYGKKLSLYNANVMVCRFERSL